MMNPSVLAARLDELALLAVDPDFEGSAWLGQLTGELWKSGENEWAEYYGDLARFLFNIGLLGTALPKAKPVHVQDEPGYLDRKNRIAACERFLIHPAFRRSLDCRSRDEQRREQDID